MNHWITVPVVIGVGLILGSNVAIILLDVILFRPRRNKCLGDRTKCKKCGVIFEGYKCWVCGRYFVPGYENWENISCETTGNYLERRQIAEESPYKEHWDWICNQIKLGKKLKAFPANMCYILKQDGAEIFISVQEEGMKVWLETMAKEILEKITARKVMFLVADRWRE